MTTTELTNISKSFGTVPVIQPLDLSVKSGEFMVVVGPSGCGKSTLLRLIAGLETPTTGHIMIDGTDVSNKEPSARGVAMVFQTYALYPHMSVRDNMSFGLEMAGVTKIERDQLVLQAAHTLQLEDYLDRKPKQLSGGQRQRVAIGRAIVRDPKVFLFDEPLSNLDAELRVQMRLEIAKLHRELGSTMIYVTHDQVEAMTLATRIVVLNKGRIEQIGTPGELYSNPENTFVARFIGSPRMNLLPATVSGIADTGVALVDIPALNLEKLKVPLTKTHTTLPNNAVFGIRPEDFIYTTDNNESAVSLRCEIVEDLGNNVYMYNSVSRDDSIVAALPRYTHPTSGTSVYFRISEVSCYLFTTDGKRM